MAPTAGLQLDWIALLHTNIYAFYCWVQSNPFKLETSPIQWLFPLRSKWVSSGQTKFMLTQAFLMCLCVNSHCNDLNVKIFSQKLFTQVMPSWECKISRFNAIWNVKHLGRKVHCIMGLVFTQNKCPFTKIAIWGSVCGTGGRVVASNTRDPGFESSHQRYLFTIE